MASRFKAAINTMTGGGLDIDGGKWGRAFADGLDAAVRAIDDFGDAMSRAMQSDVGQAAIGSWKSMFNMLSETGGAAVRVLDGLGKGAMSFGTAFVENLSPGSTAKISAGLEHAFGAMTQFYDKFANAMSKVNVDLQGFGAKAGSLGGTGRQLRSSTPSRASIFTRSGRRSSAISSPACNRCGSSVLSWASNAVAQLKALFTFNISLPNLSGGAPGAPASGTSPAAAGPGGSGGALSKVRGNQRLIRRRQGGRRPSAARSHLRDQRARSRDRHHGLQRLRDACHSDLAVAADRSSATSTLPAPMPTRSWPSSRSRSRGHCSARDNCHLTVDLSLHEESEGTMWNHNDPDKLYMLLGVAFVIVVGAVAILAT